MDHDAALPPPELLLQHAGWVRRLAAELVGDGHAADDVAQETWLAFFLRPPDTGRPLRPWLARVVRNRAAMRRRARANRDAREAEVARPEALPSAGELVERAELQRTLVDAVLALEEPYRETLLLRYYEGLTPAEIGARRGLPGATVRSHLHRGHEQLRARLDRAHGGDRAAWAALFFPLIERGAAPGSIATTVGRSAASVVPATIAALTCALVLLVATTVWIAPWRSAPHEAELDGSAPRTPSALIAETSSSELSSLDGARTPVVATPASQQALAVTLVDLRTGTPLPDYVITSNGVMLRSDAGGRIMLPAGTTSVTPIDDPRLAVDKVVRHGLRARQPIVHADVAVVAAEDERALNIAVPSGPTYRLRLVGESRVAASSLVARLEASGLSPYLDDGRERPLAPLRGELGAPWVRFGRMPDGADDPRASWTLVVQSVDGLWAGATRVDDVTVGQVAPIELALERTSAVEGMLDAGAGEELLGLFVTLQRAAPSADGEPALVASTAPDEGGRFALHALTPGEYQLCVRSAKHAQLTRAVTLVAGERIDVELVLVPLARGGMLSGSIVSESRGYSGQLLVFLMDADGAVLGVFPTTWAEKDGARVARFEFEDAPGGPLHLDVVSLADAVTFVVAPVPLSAPCSSVEIVLRDTRPASDVVFDAVDAETGDAITEFEVTVEVEGGPPRTYVAFERAGARHWTLQAGGMRWNDFDGRSPLRGLAEDAPFTWRVRARGFREARGGAEDTLRDVHAHATGDTPLRRRVLARLVPD
jgi:RNA polymerase sigma factor (sigma-70 family)